MTFRTAGCVANWRRNSSARCLVGKPPTCRGSKWPIPPVADNTSLMYVCLAQHEVDCRVVHSATLSALAQHTLHLFGRAQRSHGLRWVHTVVQVRVVPVRVDGTVHVAPERTPASGAGSSTPPKLFLRSCSSFPRQAGQPRPSTSVHRAPRLPLTTAAPRPRRRRRPSFLVCVTSSSSSSIDPAPPVSAICPLTAFPAPPAAARTRLCRYCIVT